MPKGLAVIPEIKEIIIKRAKSGDKIDGNGFYNCSEGGIFISCSNVGSGNYYTASCSGSDLGYFSCSISNFG